MKSHNFRISLYLAATFPLAAMVILAVVVALQVKALESAQQWVDHTDQVISADRELIKLNIDMETGARGFLWTGRAEFLDPYTAAAGVMDAKFADFQQLILDNPEEEARLTNLRHEFDQWRLLIAEAIERRSNDSIPDSEAVVYRDTLKRKTVMERIRVQHEQFVAGEMGLRNQRVHWEESRLRALRITCYLIAFGGIGFAWFVKNQMTILARKFRRLGEAEERARTLAKEVADLEQSALLQAAIFNSANFSSIATDAEGVIQIFNVGAQRMLGYDAAEVINNLTPADISDSQEIVARAKALSVEFGIPIKPGFEALIYKASQGIEDHYELTYVRKDGTRLPAVVSVTALRDDQGAVIGYLLIGTDNTARKQAETTLSESETRFRIMVDAVPQMVWITRADGWNIYFSQKWMDYTGLTLGESMGHGWSKPFHPDDRQRASEAWEQAVNTADGVYRIESRLRRADGVYRWWLIMGVRQLDLDGTTVKWFGTCTDIHESKLAKETMERTLQRLHEAETNRDALLRTIHLHSIVSTSDQDGRILEVNDSFCAITGFSREELVGQTHRVISSGTHTAKFWADMWSHISRGESWRGEICNRNKDGSLYWVDSIIAPYLGEDGHSFKFISIRTDITVAKRSEGELRRAAEKAEHAAAHDALTGLPNRLLLNDRIERVIALKQRRKELAALLFIDLDGFKHVNDSLGHPTGDKLLKSVAKRLEDCLRAPDTVSRQGGDEFVVLLQDVKGPEHVGIVARRILKTVEVSYAIDQHVLHLTASIGVSMYPDDGTTAELLIKSADMAMYQAKGDGRNKYRFFKAEMNTRAMQRQSIEEDLRRALDKHEFVLEYQPIIDLKSGAIIGVEALIRWHHPSKGLIAPLHFIPIAEESGLIILIGTWVLREACSQMRAWTDAGLPAITMAVNVSALQFQHEGFVEGLFAILEETGMDPRYLELEVTESVLMKNAGLAEAVLQMMRERGIRVSVDDFGTGYSGLNYLKDLHLDSLKIDQSFVREINKGSGGGALVIAIISMARSLGLKVIAEGIETLEELKFVQAEGCDEGQGYQFSHPVAAGQIALFLESGATLKQAVWVPCA